MSYKRTVVFALTVSFLLTVSTVFAGNPSFKSVGNLSVAREGHGCVMTHTGDVLIIGGSDATGNAMSSVSVFRSDDARLDPALGGLSTARTRSSVVVVNQAGQSVVYVIGGYEGTVANARSSAVVDVIRYDVGQNNWRVQRLSTLPQAVGDCRAVYNGTNAIIVSGGTVQTGGAIGSGTPSVVSARITTAGTINAIGNHVTARAAHGAYRFFDQLNNLAVIVAGGDAAPTSAELLANNTWDGRANPPRERRAFLADVSDISGTARAFGGEDGATVLSTTEWYDPKSGWRPAPRMNEARSRMGYTLVAGPTDTASAYLVVGGRSQTGNVASTELFNLPSGTNPAGSFETFYPTQQAATFPGVAMCGANVPVVTGGGPSVRIEVLQPLRSADVVFPNTEVGGRSDSMQIVITNTWLLPVTIKDIRVAGDPDFLVAADTSEIILDPGRSRVIFAWFRPTTPGRRSTKVILDLGPVSDELELSGNGLASTVSLASGIIDHGEVLVGESSIVCIPLLVNNGSDTAVVDSIVVPAGRGLRVVSPQGRSLVGPGDTLEVCIEYKPTARETLMGDGEIFLGARSFPFANIGSGVRRTGVVQVSATCDTVSAIPGDTVAVLVTLRNVADLDVNISRIDVTSAIPGSVWLDDPTIAPLVLAPLQSVPVLVNVAILSEGRRDIVVSCQSNSDSAMIGTACIVTKSRSIVPSVSVIDVGTVCIGDTIIRSINITNVSSTETIDVQDATVESIPGEVLLQVPTNVMPRSSVSATVVIAPDAAGVINGRVVFTGTESSSTIPIVGTVLPSTQLGLTAVEGEPAQRITMPIEITSGGATTYDFLVVHPPEAFVFDEFTSQAGTPAVDQAQTTITRTERGSNVSLVFTAPTAATAEVIATITLLRSDQTTVDVWAERSDAVSDCISSDTATVLIGTSCGGERSGVRLSNRTAMMVQPNPATQTVSVHINHQAPGSFIECVDVSGKVVATYPANTTVDVSDLPRGLYSIRLMSTNGFHNAVPLLLLP